MGSRANSTTEGPKQGSGRHCREIIRLELSGKGGKEGERGEIRVKRGGRRGKGEMRGNYRGLSRAPRGGRRDQHAIRVGVRLQVERRLKCMTCCRFSMTLHLLKPLLHVASGVGHFFSFVDN